ncbi:MAG: cytidine deaminase [Azospirillum sp.]|nr:cytidine deaminase [Azospirillum sp.]MCZ8123232.1 cytidine deaminase [Magnetospirillum sp.]
MRLVPPPAEALIALARDAAERYARPEISRFRVGAALVGATTGTVYLGGNWEIAGPSIAQTVHAEQAAFAAAWHAGERGVAALAVTHAPCGHCRQFLFETLGADFPVFVDGARRTTLTRLLPSAFGPRDLKGASALMATPPVRLTLPGKPGALARLALSAARAAYAPHTKSHMGVALELADGRRFAGRHAESAAYNPSLPALQSALILRHLSGATAPIVRVAFVRRAGGGFDETLRARELLAHLAPRAKLAEFAAR